MVKTSDLSQFPFFSDVTGERLDEIASFSLLQTYCKGDLVFQNDEPARNLYGLASGDINLSILFKEEIVSRDIRYEEYISTHVEIMEKPVVIESVKTGDIFGWSALVEPERMTATARCETDCDIVLIPAIKIKQLFGRDPELGYLLSAKISNIIAQRLNSRTQKLVETWCSLFKAEKIDTV